MSAHPSDQELLAACRAGRQEAWGQLVERYSRLVHSVPRRYGLPQADADDVLQATFVALVTTIGRGDHVTGLAAWLATVAHRECWRIGRQRGRALPAHDFESVAAPKEATVADLEEEQAVRTALASLGTPCRELLTALHSQPGEPHYPDVAAALGMPVGSIGPTRARCLAKLRRILEDSGICGTPERSVERRTP